LFPLMMLSPQKIRFAHANDLPVNVCARPMVVGKTLPHRFELWMRQLGVPFSKAELGAGSGNRIRYGFDHLIALGVAVFGLDRGMRPREVAGILVDHRAEFRRCYRDRLAALPESAFTAEWVKSRGTMVPFSLLFAILF